ncbi:MAG: BatD family protein [Myxococcota bacterium]
MTARLVVLLALFAPAAARAAPDVPLEVQVSIDREQVFLHEQAVLSIVVRHPGDARASWEPPPFDGFWAERIGTRGLPPDEHGLPRTEFRRALFPTRTGDLRIATSKLVLVGEGGSELEIPVPGAALRVVPLPADVPADALVGQLAVRVSSSDDRLRLGKALSLTVELAGEGNVWDAKAPALESLVGPDVEVFPETPLLSIGESAGRATTRRTFRYALVPARAGTLRIEPLRFPYFDPTTRALATAESAPLVYTVFSGSADAEQRDPWENRPVLRPATGLPLAWLAFGFAAALGLSYLLLSRRRRAQAALGLPGSPPSPRKAFDAALEARDTSQCLPLLANAVRAAITVRHGFDALPLTSQEIAARNPDPEALALLLTLDRTRFAGTARADDALVARVRAYLGL